MNEYGLIFLISQPRSGSSMVQQLILSEDTIASTPEPWQMLNLISTYKHHDIISSYNHKYAVINFNRHLELLENGLDHFKLEIKKLALELYNRHSNGSPYFLDKTPRYYHIIQELIEMFPRAKFIFLVRNPLSVFASILDYNFKGDIISFLKSEDRLDDLMIAPRNIIAAAEKHPGMLQINYESIINDTKKGIKSIFEYLQINTSGEIHYKLRDEFIESTAVDTKSLKKHNKPVKDYLTGWKRSINTSQKKIAALGFLECLKSEFPNYFSYDLDQQISELERFKPQKKTWFNLGFRILSAKEEKLSILDLLKKRVYLKIQRTLYK